MKKILLLPTAFFFLFLSTGCDLSGESAEDLIVQAQESVAADSDSSSPSATTPSATGSTSSGGGSSSGFLWKPVSESNGNLVVLLPYDTHGRTQQICTISGSFGSESASLRGEDHNGGRPHFYFSKSGGSYGSNITVQAPLTDGSIFSTVVANGSSRTEL